MPNKEFINILKSDYQTLEKSIKSFLRNYSKITDFLGKLFEYIPAEFFIILFLSLGFLMVLNSVSKKGSSLSFLISVALSTGLCVFGGQMVLQKSRNLQFLFSAGALLIAAYGFAFFGYLVQYAKKQYRKKKLPNPETFEQAVFNLHQNYNEAAMYLHLHLAKKDLDYDDLREKLNGLKLSAEGMLVLLDAKRKKEVTDSAMPTVKDDRIGNTEILAHINSH